MNQNVYLVSVADEGKRLDQFLKERTGLTRSEVQKWIKAGNVSIMYLKETVSRFSGMRRKNRNLLGKISLLIFYMKTMI